MKPSSLLAFSVLLAVCAALWFGGEKLLQIGLGENTRVAGLLIAGLFAGGALGKLLREFKEAKNAR